MTDRPDIAAKELEAVLRKHGLSAVFVVATKETVAYRISMAKWSAFQFDNGRMNMSLRFETPEEEANTALSMGVMVDMQARLLHCAELFRDTLGLANETLATLGIQTRIAPGDEG